MTNISSSIEPIPNSGDPVQNIITPSPIDAAPTSAMLDGTPKKRNYPPLLLAILVLLTIVGIFFLIYIGKSRSVPFESLTQKNSSPEQINKKLEGKNPLPVDLPIFTGSLDAKGNYQGKYASFILPSSWKPGNPSANIDQLVEFAMFNTSLPTTNSKTDTIGSGWVSLDFLVFSSPNNAVYGRLKGSEKQSQIMLDGQPATKAIHRTGAGEALYEESIVVVHNSLLYRLNFYTQDPELESVINKEINKIIPTFKFIDSQIENETAQNQCQPITQYQTLNIEPNNPETASWKSFTDENGLSFKYPNYMQIIDYGPGDKRISVMTQKEFDDICRGGCQPPPGLRTESDKVEPYQDIEEYLKQEAYHYFTCKKGGIRTNNLIISKLNQYKIGSQIEVVFVEFSGCGGDACNNLFIKNMQTNKTVEITSIPELQDFEDFISTISLK